MLTPPPTGTSVVCSHIPGLGPLQPMPVGSPENATGHSKWLHIHWELAAIAAPTDGSSEGRIIEHGE
jgi:hypothetical protein